MAIKDHLFFTSYIAMFGRFLTNLNYHIADEVWGQIELVGHSKKNEQSTALLEWLTQVKDNERLRQWAERNKWCVACALPALARGFWCI